MARFGKELIFDLHDCDPTTFNRDSIKRFLVKLCVLLDMEREKLCWWDYKDFPEEYVKAPPHLKGISVIQFIKTSNITIHTLDTLGKMYLNIFSCKDFDSAAAKGLVETWFDGVVAHEREFDRE